MDQHSLSSLTAISPLDGRYRNRLDKLGDYVSEDALVRARFFVELHWLHFLLSKEEIIGGYEEEAKKAAAIIKSLIKEPPEDFSRKIKEIEETTNHDVKAVEYFIQDLLKSQGIGDRVLALIHFGCTSEDINNLAYAQMLSQLRGEVLLPHYDRLLDQLVQMISDYTDVPMLSRTHGQAASPTTVGKELAVFGHRLYQARIDLADVAVEAKMSGAVGNYNAHKVALPSVDWEYWAKEFIEIRMGLTQNLLTTQIENHDWVARYCDATKRINAILLDMARDIWGYISLGYFKLKVEEGEVGSSTMPHKVNPIDFENAEGNLGLSSALLNHLAEKLAISRWQRDLSDSTALRSLGCAFAYNFLAVDSLLRGLKKLALDRQRLDRDLSDSWEVLGEAVQTVMRLGGRADAYDLLKKATRGQRIDKAGYERLLAELPLSDAERQSLTNLSPERYIGEAQRLAHDFVTSHMHRLRGRK